MSSVNEVSVMRKLLHIEPYSAVHEAACRGVLKRVFGEDDVSQGYYRLTPRRTVLASLQGRLIGFASIWDNVNHPETLRSGVVVLPRYRRQGVGGQLWAALRQTGSDGYPFVTSLWETQVAGHAFALRCGFRQIRRTHTAVLPINQVDTDAFHGLSEQLAKQGYRLLSYGDAPASERAQMAALLQQTYAVTHAANPVRPFSAAEWSARAFPEDVGLVSSSWTLEIRGNVKPVEPVPSFGSGGLSLSAGRPVKAPPGAADAGLDRANPGHQSLWLAPKDGVGTIPAVNTACGVR